MGVSKYHLELVQQLFPGTSFGEIRKLDIGWSSEILFLDDEYVVKIPRTSEAGVGIEKEIALTKILSGKLPVKIPECVSEVRQNGLKAAAFKRISGVMFTSQPVDEKSPSLNIHKFLTGDHAKKLSRQIASIMCTIHEVDLEPLKEILYRYTDDTWDIKIHRWIDDCRKIGEKTFSGNENQLCGEFLDLIEERYSEYVIPETLIHGDFGGWNMLFDSYSVNITGLLDWSDTRIGDPAKDVTELIYDFGKPFTDRILRHVNKTKDPDLMQRAELYLKLAGFQDLEYGQISGSDFFMKRGLESIRKELKNLENP